MEKGKIVEKSLHIFLFLCLQQKQRTPKDNFDKFCRYF